MVGVHDGAGGFFAEDLGLLRGVEACAEVSAMTKDQYMEDLIFNGERGGLRVDVVDTDEVILNEDLAFFGLGNRQVGFVL